MTRDVLGDCGATARAGASVVALSRQTRVPPVSRHRVQSGVAARDSRYWEELGRDIDEEAVEDGDGDIEQAVTVRLTPASSSRFIASSLPKSVALL
jgi:hypothetical protein